MAIRVTVAIRDAVGKDFRTAELKRVIQGSKLDVEKIARECEKTIQETIMNKTRLPTGKLASFMKAEPITDGWGVGDIATLDANVPYWNHIDKGSEGIGANWQHFLPRGYWSNGRWIEDPNGSLGIKPKTPIPAINYIADTLAQMGTKIPSILMRTQ